MGVRPGRSPSSDRDSAPQTLVDRPRLLPSPERCEGRGLPRDRAYLRPPPIRSSEFGREGIAPCQSLSFGRRRDGSYRVTRGTTGTMAAGGSGETVLFDGPVVWVGPQGRRPGTIRVTSQEIIFEGAAGSGPLGPARPLGPRRWGMRPGPMGRPGGGAPGMGLRIPLWRCRSAAVAPAGSEPGVVVTLLSRQVFLATAEAATLAAAITRARAAAPPAPPGALGPGGPGGRSEMPRCEYCGRLSSATATQCEHCGAPF